MADMTLAIFLSPQSQCNQLLNAAMLPSSPSIFSKIRHSMEVAFADLTQKRSVQPADCVFIVGPGNADDIPALERNARHLNIRAHFVGDGVNPITQEMIQRARQRGIIGKHTEVVCINHGDLLRKEGEQDQHMLLVGKQPGRGTRWISTTSVLQWIRDPLPSDTPSTRPSEPWKGNVHVIACKVGSLGKQIGTPGIRDASDAENQTIWRQGHVILHGSGKLLATQASLESCATLMRSIAHAKHNNGGELDFGTMLEDLAMNAVDTVSVAGGDLQQAFVIRSPKTVLELSPDHMLGKLRQQAALAKLSDARSPVVSGSTANRNGQRLPTPVGERSVISEMKLANYLQTRLMHLRSREKLDQLSADLHRFPGLTKLRFAMYTSPLMFACFHQYPGEQEVRVTEIARILIESGADIYAIDSSGATALHHAARRGDPSLIALLAQRGAESAARDKSGRNALHWACEAGKNAPGAVQALLRHGDGIDVNCSDKRGMTPLHMAIKAKDAKTVELLLAAGANPTKGLWFWDSPAKMAARLGDQQLADSLTAAARHWRSRPPPHRAT